MPSSHLILCHPLLLLSSIFPTIRVIFNELALHLWWLKFWSFSFSICPFHEYSGFISFRIYWFDLLAVQGTLKSLLQHHLLFPSILIKHHSPEYQIFLLILLHNQCPLPISYFFLILPTSPISLHKFFIFLHRISKLIKIYFSLITLIF